MSRREGTEALIFDTSLVSRGSFTGHMASSSPLHDTTLAGHLLYIGIHNKSLVDVGEGDFTWAFIVAPENAKPESKYQKYWMSEVPDTTGLTNVLGRKEETLIAFKEDDLLCKILLAEVEDMGKLREVMCLPQSPKTVIEDMKGESMRWVRGMLGKLMREGCLKRGLVAWDVIMEEGSKMAESSVTFDERHYLP